MLAVSYLRASFRENHIIPSVPRIIQAHYALCYRAEIRIIPGTKSTRVTVMRRETVKAIDLVIFEMERILPEMIYHLLLNPHVTECRALGQAVDHSGSDLKSQ
jgi:hypothetical protein